MKAVTTITNHTNCLLSSLRNFFKKKTSTGHLFSRKKRKIHNVNLLIFVPINKLTKQIISAETKQSHTTICVVDHHSDGTYVLRALKQKIYVDGLCYLLQEIYGIENKNINKVSILIQSFFLNLSNLLAIVQVSIDDETDDNGSECVICMSDTRDTLILPCRHLCLCNSCADSLRYQVTLNL